MKKIDWKKTETSELIASLIMIGARPEAFAEQCLELTEAMREDPKRWNEYVDRLGLDLVNEINRRIPIPSASPNDPHAFACAAGSELCAVWLGVKVTPPYCSEFPRCGLGGLCDGVGLPDAGYACPKPPRTIRPSRIAAARSPGTGGL